MSERLRKFIKNIDLVVFTLMFIYRFYVDKPYRF